LVFISLMVFAERHVSRRTAAVRHHPLSPTDYRKRRQTPAPAEVLKETGSDEGRGSLSWRRN